MEKVDPKPMIEGNFLLKVCAVEYLGLEPVHNASSLHVWIESNLGDITETVVLATSQAMHGVGVALPEYARQLAQAEAMTRQ